MRLAGYFIHDATGHAPIQIMTTPPVKIASPDSPTPDDPPGYFNGYIAYYGTYTVDYTNSVFKLRVRGIRLKLDQTRQDRASCLATP